MEADSTRSLPNLLRPVEWQSAGGNTQITFDILSTTWDNFTLTVENSFFQNGTALFWQVAVHS